MTEAEWATCNNPKEMLIFLADRRKASDRKLRLFACACFRRVWAALPDPHGRAAVEVAERYADGLATEAEREEALARAANCRLFGGGATRWAVVTVARTGAILAVDVAGQTAACSTALEYDPALWAAESQAQCDLLRDLVGPLPFRSVEVTPSWRSPQVLEVARAIYSKRAFGRMEELGQVLQRSGCDDRNVLHHCLWWPEHARGCWVIDLLLKKE